MLVMENEVVSAASSLSFLSLADHHLLIRSVSLHHL
jgi:hypothetical protein